MNLSSLQSIELHDNPHIAGTCILLFKFVKGNKAVLKSSPVKEEDIKELEYSLSGMDADFKPNSSGFVNLRFGSLVVYTAKVKPSVLTPSSLGETKKLIKTLERTKISKRLMELHQKW